MKDAEQVRRKEKFDCMRGWLMDEQDGQATELVCLYLLVSEDASPSPKEIAWATGLKESEVYPTLHELVRECEERYGPRSARRMRGIFRQGDQVPRDG
jgi:hypothetical protein